MFGVLRPLRMFGVLRPSRMFGCFTHSDCFARTVSRVFGSWFLTLRRAVRTSDGLAETLKAVVTLIVAAVTDPPTLCFITGMCTVSYIVIDVERALYFNRVKEVNDLIKPTGQLMGFVVSLGGIWTLLAQIFGGWRAKILQERNSIEEEVVEQEQEVEQEVRQVRLVEQEPKHERQVEEEKGQEAEVRRDVGVPQDEPHAG
ncbi:hypothetical protein BDZ91DRAFT_736931, partial [Kalaharituber pfeilii]